MSKLDYARRVAGVARRDPREFLDRLRGQVEQYRERAQPKSSPTASGDWHEELHKLLGAPAECRLCAEFDDAWSAMEGTLAASGHVAGKGYDGGIGLARGAYCAVRHLRPAHVVETGVARGVTSRIILDALAKNGDSGQLHSVDLPPLAHGWHTESAIAVPDNMGERWDFRRGAARRVLPGLFRQLGPVSLFIHDSLHTYANMTWELELSWRNLTQGGLILCDDVEDNHAFEDFVAKVGAPHALAREPMRTGYIGAIKR